MECVKITIDMKTPNAEYIIRPIGDIHIGNVNCDIKKLDEVIEYIRKTPNCLCIGMGDYIENIMPYANGSPDKRWNSDTTVRTQLTTEEQTEVIMEKLVKIKDKILTMTWGNHEWKTMNEKRFINDFCKPLDAKFLGYVGYLYLTFKYKGKEMSSYLLLIKHAGSNAAKTGSAMNHMEDFGSSFDYDIQLMGHNHGTFVQTSLRIGYDKKTNNLVEKKQLHGNTGTFLRSYQKGNTSYVERQPNRTKRVATIAFTLIPKTGDMYGHD